MLDAERVGVVLGRAVLVGAALVLACRARLDLIAEGSAVPPDEHAESAIAAAISPIVARHVVTRMDSVCRVVRAGPIRVPLWHCGGMDISGNTIFIPGATSGLGLALATGLQEKGNTVIIGGRRTELLDELGAKHGLATVSIDVTDPDSIAAARDHVVAAHPDLDAVVAMAGIMIEEDLHTDAFLAGAERQVVTNLLGPIRLWAAFAQQLTSRPRATFLTVSSGLAHVPKTTTPTYNATKAAIHQFSESLRLQLADTNVQVIEIVPPAVRTELTPGQSQAAYAMPLEEYTQETIALLESQPDATEILVERVKRLRFAEVNGTYAEATAALNGAVAEHHAAR